MYIINKEFTRIKPLVYCR